MNESATKGSPRLFKQIDRQHPWHQLHNLIWELGNGKREMPPAYQCNAPVSLRHMGNTRTPDGRVPRLNVRHRLKALVVDWEIISRTLLSAILSNFGVEVQAVENGMQAMEILESGQGSFDLVTVELFMPNMNGREIARRVRRMGLDCRIVGISAGTVTSEILAFLAVADEFMEKPPDLERIAEIVTDLDAQKSGP